MRLSSRALWLAIFLALPTVALAQTASLRGTVADRQGGVVVGAVVVLTTEAGMMREAASSAEGTFVFDGLRPGQYTAIVTSPGFSTWSQVFRLTEATVDLMITLDIGGISEVVG